MGKIFCIMGKSSSGKDTIYKNLLSQKDFPLFPIIPCTTRPKRKEETPGVEYYFYTEEELQNLQAQGKIIELRSYHTIHGVWYYFTPDDGRIDLKNKNYLMIGTLDSYLKMKDYFGNDKLISIYLQVEDGIRLKRALDREQKQEYPKYAEMCRRYLADEQDFSQERLKKADIKIIFQNQDLLQVTNEINDYIKVKLKENLS